MSNEFYVKKSDLNETRSMDFDVAIDTIIEKWIN